jgi:autotransporter-associated beta strand protein/T5SS/PEP-CTERM-associated repeat protein
VICIGGLMAAAPLARAQTSLFTNPIAPSGADPWVTLYNGNYYYTDTTGNNVSIAESSTLPGIGTAAMTTVYTPPSGYGNVWAPELQLINGSWYIYYAMGPSSNTNNQRTYVLKANTSNPMGSYSLVGQINDPTNDWAIDPTVLSTNGSLYFIWSGWAGSTNVAQNLYIAPMSSPTTISGSRVLISSPTNGWEQQGGPPSVNEGPVVLTSPGGQASVIFSASGSWTNNYCLGQLELTGSNPLDPADWTKDNAGPVFASTSSVFGPGHSSYTTSNNGTRDWIVYHAAVSSGSGWDRNIRTQPFSWNPDGTPSFGEPVPVTVPIQWGPTSWIGAINESNNDTVHSYTNSANWVNGYINDSFANVTLTDNTTLYFNANHTTSGDMIFTYGSGQDTLSLMSASSAAYTLSLSGNVIVNILGGANSLYFGSASNPLIVAMGGSQTNFNIAGGNSVYLDSNLTGTGGLNLSGGGVLTLRGYKTYSGPTLITSGTLAAGDGSAPSSSTNLPPETVVTIGSAGTLQLNGLSGSASNAETIAGLTGSGSVTAPLGAESLTIANATACTFSGSITGSNLSITEAGPGTQSLAGNSSFGGQTLVTGGILSITGSETGASNLFIKHGSATIAGSLTSLGSSSIGQSSGDSGTLNVSGSLSVQSDLNVGDVSATGVLNISTGAVISCDTLYVGKFVTSNGTVNQTGGTVHAMPNGVDWRIGGADSSADSAAVGVYNLTNGSLNTGSSNFQIGAYGTGTFIQKAGTVTSGGYISIGRFPGGNGTYNITGGSLTGTAQPFLVVGEQGTGTLLVSGSASVNAVTLSIGHNGGVGSVTQSGGIVYATNDVLLGQNAGGIGTYILSGGTLVTGGITRGTGTGNIDFNGGAVDANRSSVTFLQGLSAAIIESGGAIFNTSGFNITVNQPLIHDVSISGTDGGLTKLGNGTLSIGGLETYTGATTVMAGTLAFAPNTGASVLIRPVGSLSVASGSVLIAGADSNSYGSSAAKTLLVAQGSVSSAGTIDLGTNDLDVKNGNLNLLTQLIRQGYNPGGDSWTGTGITSLAAANDTTHLTALGVMQNSTGGTTIYSVFDTEPAAASDVLVKDTYYGDSNLDGKVDGSDYSRIDDGYLSQLTGWQNGDFNYDGVIDGSDYTLIDNAFNNQGAQISDQLASPTAQVANSSAVPEPATFSLLATGAFGLLSRRRRRGIGEAADCER